MTKISDYEANGSTDMSVNLPNLSLGAGPASLSRIRLIHANVPGVLARVNQVLADAGANVDGQILSTSGATGYVLTDVSSPLDGAALARLEALDSTIRLIVTPLR